MFEMTAGFSYDCNSPEMKKAFEETDGRCPTRETMKYLAKDPLDFEPGDIIIKIISGGLLCNQKFLKQELLITATEFSDTLKKI